MGREIDSKIVEIKFDNKEFEKNVQATIKSLDGLTKALKLEKSAHGFQNITHAANKVDLSSISASAEKVNLGMIGMVTVASTVFRRMTEAAMTAGQNIAASIFTVSPKAGFEEYELKMGAIQTIMAGTGESLEVVNKYLQELNEYSDRTIYSFKDMTSNIGKFTNAGVKLPQAVAAIKGIANVAALSGANAEEASRSMYNFSQSLANGFVALIDWKSIGMANMATMEFKNELLASAVAMGTVKKVGKDMYIAPGMKTAKSGVQMFTQELDKQWLTTDALNKTLTKYQDVTTDLGRRATEAATNIKTFTQMVSVVKESLQSGWAQSWEYIFGNLEDAKKLWTGLAMAIGKFLEPMENARNTMLKFWSENGGRAAVIQGFVNIFKAFGAVLKPIKDVLKNLLPKVNMGKVITGWSKGFEKFTSKLIPSKKVIEVFGNVLKIFFGIIAIGFKGAKFVLGSLISYIKGYITLIGNMIGPIDGIKTALASALEYISGAIESLSMASVDSIDFAKFFDTIFWGFVGIGQETKKFLSKFSMVADILSIVISKFKKLGDGTKRVSDSAKSVAKALKDVSSIYGSGSPEQTIGDKIANMGKAIQAAFAKIDWVKVGEFALLAIAGGFIYKMIKLYKEVRDRIKFFVDLAETGTKKVFAIMDGFTGVLKGMQSELKAKALLNIAIAIGVLAASMFLISKIDPERLLASIGTISALIIELSAIMVGFSKMDINPSGLGSAGVGLILMAGSVLILAFALEKLGKLKPEVVTQGLYTVMLLLAELGAIAQLVNTDKSMMFAGVGMLLMAFALSKLVDVVTLFGEMDLEVLKQGGYAVAALMAALTLSTRLISPKELGLFGLNMLLIAVGLKIISEAIQLIGGLSEDTIYKGLITIGVALLYMVGALDQLPTDAPVRAAGVLILAIAIGVLALVLEKLGAMEWPAIIKSLVVLGGAMLALTLALKYASSPDVLLGAAAIAIVMASLLVLAMVLEKIGAMDPNAIKQALLTIGVALVGLAVIAYALMASGAIAALALLGVAVLLMGAAMLAAGAGMFLFSYGIKLLGEALQTGGKDILAFILAVAAQLPTLALALTRAIGAFATGMIDQLGPISESLKAMTLMFLKTMTELLPKIFEFISLIITGLLNLLVEKIPEINAALLQLLLALGQQLRLYLPILILIAGELAVSFINGMAAYYDKIIDAGTNFIIKIIEGIASNLNKIITAAAETLLAFINGLTAAVKTYGPQIRTAVGNLMGAILDEVKAFIGLDKFSNVGGDLVAGITKGIEAATDGPLKAIKGVIDGILGAARAAGIIRSPSRLFAKGVGVPIVLGIVEGILRTQKSAMEAAKSVVVATYSAMEKAGAAAVDVFSTLPDPTITPVIDLDAVYSGVKTIASLMNGASTVKMAGSISAGMGATDTNVSQAKTSVGNSSPTFIQNNYSPKALSRFELYRQTNRLILAKG